MTVRSGSYQPTETARQRNRRLRHDILDAHDRIIAATTAEEKIRAEFEDLHDHEQDAWLTVYGDRWNEAHDEISAAQANLRLAQRMYGIRDLNPETLALINQNID